MLCLSTLCVVPIRLLCEVLVCFRSCLCPHCRAISAAYAGTTQQHGDLEHWCARTEAWHWVKVLASRLTCSSSSKLKDFCFSGSTFRSTTFCRWACNAGNNQQRTCTPVGMLLQLHVTFGNVTALALHLPARQTCPAPNATGRRTH